MFHMDLKKIFFLAVMLLIGLLFFNGSAEGSRIWRGKFRFGAGPEIQAGETISESLVMGGATVEMRGRVEGRLEAFGANVYLPGSVQGETGAYGANVAVSGEVADELRAYGANVVLSGKFLDKVKTAGADVTLSGTFEKDVEAYGARVVLTPSTVIRGDFRYGAETLVQPEGARIMGRVIPQGIQVDRGKMAREARRAFLLFGFIWWVLSTAALIVVGLLLHYFLPGQTGNVLRAFTGSPWKNLGIGLILLVAVPLGVVLALLTVVGIPAGIIAALLFGVALYLSRIFVGVWIGRKILGTLKQTWKEAFFGPLVLGVVILGLLRLIPILGWLVRWLLLLIGMGAIWQAIRSAREPGRAAGA